MKSTDAKFAGPLQALTAASGYRSMLIHPGRYSAAVHGGGGSGQGHVAVSLMSYNLLAPPYRRRETEVADGSWRPRVLRQIEEVAAADADIVGLQEFWHCSEPYVSLWRRFAEARGYTLFISPRTGEKQDGCGLLLRTAAPEDAPDESERRRFIQLGERAGRFPHAEPARGFCTCSYKDWGNRIVQLVEVSVCGRPLTLLHTHLTFPHASAHDPIMRKNQGRKLGELARSIDSPVLLLGDLNGDAADPALVEAALVGRLTPMPGALEAPGTPPQWVSHVAHTGALMSCDLALSSAGCRIADDWRLGGSEEDLIEGRLPSDHRPLLVTICLDAPSESS